MGSPEAATPNRDPEAERLQLIIFRRRTGAILVALAVIGIHFYFANWMIHAWTGHSPDSKFIFNWLKHIANHWFLFGMIAVLFAVVGGFRGRGVGLHRLFRTQPGWRWWNNYSFWGSFAASSFVGVVWELVAASHIWDGTDPSTIWWVFEKPYLQAGNYGTYLLYVLMNSVPFLIVLLVLAGFPHEPKAKEGEEQRIRSCCIIISDIGWCVAGTGFGAFVIAVEVWPIMHWVVQCHQWSAPFSGMPSLLGWVVAVPFLIAGLAGICYRATRKEARARFVVGLIVTAVGSGVAWFGGATTWKSDAIRWCFPLAIVAVAIVHCADFGIRSVCRGADYDRVAERNRNIPHIFHLAILLVLSTAFILAEIFWNRPFLKQEAAGPDACSKEIFWSVFAILGSAYLAIPFYPKVAPSVTIFVVFSWIASIDFLFCSMEIGGQVLLLVVIVVLIWTCNSRTFKYRFPGVPNGAPDNPHRPGLLSDTDVLFEWKKQFGPPFKPRLVIVGASGGAYRATFWTSLVLEAISKKIPGFDKHIRIFTGASGGMVAAAYFAKRGSSNQLTSYIESETGRDSLSQVVQHFMQHDIPLTFSPGGPGQYIDRGVILERSWKTLAGNFSGLAALEAKGLIPSIILSPMLIETGHRLLISNLDLAYLSETLKFDGTANRALAIELFKKRPETYESLKLQTAVRMNATFPLISPAVSLDLGRGAGDVGVCRVTDAGFYDNFG